MTTASAGGPERPPLADRLAYRFGRTLDPRYRAWVRDDLLGPGAAARYVLTFTLPALAIVSLFLLLPGPWWIPWAIMVLLVAPVVYFAFALMYVWRRNRLRAHGLDPALSSEKRQRRADLERAAYERRYRA